MYRFKIYKKSKGIYWSNTLIVYSVLLPSIFILYVNNEFFRFEENLIHGIFTTLSILAFVYGLVMKLSGLLRYEALRGKLENWLVIETDSISMADKNYSLAEIKKIEIYNEDYEGRFKYTSKSSFEANLSRGVANAFVLTLNSGERIACNFQQNHQFEMQNAMAELVYYYKSGKFSFLHLIEVLNISDYDKIQDFKKEFSISVKY